MVPRFDKCLALNSDETGSFVQWLDCVIAFGVAVERLQSGTSPLTRSVVPVYAAALLTSLPAPEGDKRLCVFLRTLLHTLANAKAPLHSLGAALKELW